MCSFWYYYGKGLTNVYPDGNSKLAHSRRVFDNYDGVFKLANLGLIWLWGQSSLMVPTVWIPWMYHSGMSGSIISIASFVMTAILVYEIVKLMTGSKLGGLVASSIILTTLNLVYFATTPMTEPQIIASFALCGLAMIKFELAVKAKSQSLKWLVIAALSFGYAVNVRYDMWFMTAAIGFPLMALILWTNNVRGWEFVVKLGQIFSVPAVGVLGWILWQYLQTGQPFYFANGPYSAHQKDVVGLNQYDSVGNILVSIRTYISAVRWNFDDRVLVLAVGGALIYGTRFVLRKERLISPVFFAGICLFNVESLFSGQSTIAADTTHQLNIRYGLTVVIAIAVLYAYIPGVLSASSRCVVRYSGYLVAALAIGLATQSLVVQLSDPVKNTTVLTGYLTPDYYARVEMAECMAERYDNGGILIDVLPPANEPLTVESRINQSEFLTETYSQLWKQALAEPLYFTDWIYVSQGGDRVGDSIAQVPNFKSYYDKTSCSNSSGTLYLRKEEYRHHTRELHVEE